MAPQIIMLIIAAISLVAGAYLHGKPTTGKHSFPLSFVAWIIQMWLLYFGGFFDNL